MKGRLMLPRSICPLINLAAVNSIYREVLIISLTFASVTLEGVYFLMELTDGRMEGSQHDRPLNQHRIWIYLVANNLN